MELRGYRSSHDWHIKPNLTNHPRSEVEEYLQRIEYRHVASGWPYKVQKDLYAAVWLPSRPSIHPEHDSRVGTEQNLYGSRHRCLQIIGALWRARLSRDNWTIASSTIVYVQLARDYLLERGTSWYESRGSIILFSPSCGDVFWICKWAWK